MTVTIIRGEQPTLCSSVSFADDTEPTEAEIARRVDALAPMKPTGRVWWLKQDCLNKWQMWIELEDK